MKTSLPQFIRSLAATILIAAGSISAFADGNININSPTSEPANGWTFSGSTLTITEDGTYTITGTTAANRIVVSSTAEITLDNISITGSINSNACFQLRNNAKVTLNVTGTNTLKNNATGGLGGAALGVPEGCSIIIQGDGTLNAEDSDHGAAIGGNGNNNGGEKCGDITITGNVTVNANSRYRGPAIGSGSNRAEMGGDIIIKADDTSNPGYPVVKADFERDAPAIGAGYERNMGTGRKIIIAGGTVTLAKGDIGGHSLSNSGTVEITGGTVTVPGTIHAQTKTITGGSVNIGSVPSGLTNGSAAAVYPVTFQLVGEQPANVSSTAITAFSADGQPDYGYANTTIGADGSIRFWLPQGNAGTPISLTVGGKTYTGTVDLSTNGAISAILFNSDPNISYIDANGQPQTESGVTLITSQSISTTLNDGWYIVLGNVTISTRIGVSATGIGAHLILADNSHLTASGGINLTGSNKLTIYAQSTGGNMGRLTANGSSDQAGIGGSSNGIITINGGTINAYGGNYGAGIGGGGTWGGGGSITINGGTVNANGGNEGAGIGGGDNGSGGSITINDGTINASGGGSSKGSSWTGGGAGIGGGFGGSSGNITINNGKVNASGGGSSVGGGAGIGGGYYRAGGSITIKGGTVNAYGHSSSYSGGAGIGGGTENDNATTIITISGGTVTANGGNYGAGIGGGDGYSGGGEGGTITITGGTVKANGGSDAAAIGGGDKKNNTKNCTVTITGGSVNMSNHNGPQPKNSVGADVWLNTLTVGSVGDGVAITAGNISSIACDATNTPPAPGAYGIKDVKTRDGSKVYFYLLPADDEPLRLTANGQSYSSAYTRGSSNGNTRTLSLNPHDLMVSGNYANNSDYVEWVGNVLTFKRAGTYTVYGANTATAESIKVNADLSGGTYSITLNGVNIDVGDTEGACAFGMAADAKVNLTFKKDNALKSGGSSAGLEVPEGATLTIAGGAGTLAANGGAGGAGIGGGKDGAGGSIAISGGTLAAIGGAGGAGIGGGENGAGGSIAITGGMVTANSGAGGAAVGGGDGKNADGAVAITGGSITMSNHAGPQPTNGAGESVWLNTLTVGDPAVANAPVATGGIGITAFTQDGAGGYGIKDVTTDAAGKVYFYLPQSAGEESVRLTASGQNYKESYIRADNHANAKVLLMTEGHDLLVSGDNADNTSYVDWSGSVLTFKQAGAYTVSGTTFTESISVQQGGGSYDITLNDAIINVSSTSGACAFNIMSNATVSLTLAGTNVLKSGSNSAGLQAPYGATLTVAGAGSLTATGGANGAGIGSSGDSWEGAGAITIAGGTVTATGGASGAGIGDGSQNWGNGSAITITGGTVTATGGENGAGIGGGYESYGMGNAIAISGGTVTATGGANGAAIGGGRNNKTNGSVTITGGSVNMSNPDGPQPKNGAGTSVFLNTLTVGNPAVGSNIAVTAGNIGGVGCDANTPPAPGAYGVKDVKTDADGKVYFYLPQSGGSDELLLLAAGGKSYTGIYARAADHAGAATLIESLHDLIVTGTNADDSEYVSWNGDILTFHKAGAYTIFGASDTESIAVNADGGGGTYSITLNSVSVDVSSAANACAFGLSSAAVRLTLTGSSSLKSGEGKAGLQAPEGATLTIAGGAGLLVATGGAGGAGIGGGAGSAGGSINITGGMVTATAGAGGAAVGGGDGKKTDGAVAITGGSVSMSNHDGPQPTNGAGAAVWLNTLTLGYPVVVSNTAITAGSIGDVDCAEIPDASSGAYGIKDVKTDADGRVYFYLPQTAGDELLRLTAEGKKYRGIYTRAADHANQSTLSGRDLFVTGANTNNPDYVTWSGNTLTFKQAGTYTVTGVTTAENIKVNADGDNTYYITLSDMDIDVSSSYSAGAFDMSDAKVNLTLTGDNALKSGYYSGKAGLQAPFGATLKITAASTGSLTATGGSSGAGIGSDENSASGNISISGGTINAYGGNSGAGIGSGENYNGDTNDSITISGGTVNAYGGENGAGIGSRYYYYGGSVDGNIINITGGTVTANGGYNGAGIGGGNNGEGGNINISGGTVTANGNSYGAGIGGGRYGAGGNINISGGTVTANGNYYGAGIGGGRDGVGGNISISGGTVTASSNYSYGAAIGGGYNQKTSGTVTITGGSIKTNNYDGPQPTNGNSKNVYRNTLTIGDPAVAEATPITAGSIGGVPCDEIPEASSGKYGIKDVKTDAAGQVYFYLPQTDGGELLALTADDKSYKNAYTRTANNTGGATLRESLHDLIATGANADKPEYVSWSGDTLTFYKAGTYAIFGASTVEGIKVNADGDGDTYSITLGSVDIDVSSKIGACAFDMSGAKVNLTLTGDNALTSGEGKAGLQAPDGATLTITAASTGLLTAKGGSSGAGIGGGSNKGGNINIYGGTVMATGGYAGAGIGGGDDDGDGGNINIYGGMVTAAGGIGSAGIGGSYGDGGNINISGGAVTATGGSSGAGIGGGNNSEGGNITISGGTVTATSGEFGAGIGGGQLGAGGNITISGGTITANGSSIGAAIGGGYTQNATGTVIITGGSIVTNNHSGPQPTNGASVSVYLNTLTVGDAPNVGDNIAITAGIIDNAACSETPSAGEYGIRDVKTRDGGKVYFYLPQTNDSELLQLTANGKNYNNAYTRAADNDNAKNLNVSEHQLTVTGAYAGNGSYVDWSGNTLTFKKAGTYTVFGASATENIKVDADGDGGTYDITLYSVDIDVSTCAFDMADATVNLTLKGTNALKSGSSKAGLHVPDGATLNITEASTGLLTATGGGTGFNGSAGIGGGGSASTGGSITISGGTVIATGGGGAGIGGGGGTGGTGGNITITGGTVIASGGVRSAGIGGGFSSAGGITTISGGTVTAIGYSSSSSSNISGAGIGGSNGAAGGNIIISGGTVTANGGVGASGSGAGIGGGQGQNITNGTVTITGGSIKMTGNAGPQPTNGAGGTGDAVYLNTLTVGDPAVGNDVYITAGSVNNVACTPDGVDGYGIKDVKTRDDGKVYFYLPQSNHDELLALTAANKSYKNGYTRTAGNAAAATLIENPHDLIVTGANANNSEYVSWSGSTLTFDKAGTYAIFGASTVETIKVNADGDGGTYSITLGSVSVDVSGKLDACAFDMSDAKVDITLTGDNALKSGDYRAGLQAPFGATLTITAASTGSLIATSGAEGAGIGGGGDSGSTGGNINIYGGTVTANGGSYAAGIGGGGDGAGGNISITGGTVTATGADNDGAGIGGGYNGNGGNISITGGTVTANGGHASAGIGGGHFRAGGNINISGGTVTATGGHYGAGIGGGDSRAGSNITISGGTVTANGGSDGAAIGGGDDYQTTGTVTITGGSIITNNHSGPQPKNGAGADVFLNILTVGDDPNVGDDIAITAGIIDNAACSEAPSDGEYGIKDVKTRGEGKVYFYLPQTTPGSKLLQLTANGISYYNNTYTRTDANDNEAILDNIQEHQLTVTGAKADDGDYVEWIDNTLTFKKAGTYTVFGKSATENIKVDADDTYNITLYSVSIDVSAIYEACAFDMTDATVDLTLKGTNALKSGDYRAGLQAPLGATLSITPASTGLLTATGGSMGAGIGGSMGAGIGSSNGGNIYISGGTVTATGGSMGAGIGGSADSNGGNGGIINISGGTVTATGSAGSAGIGGGYGASSIGNGGNGGTITISGGTVTANGGTYSAGIGGGYGRANSGDGGTVTISGGTVTATAGSDGAAIGGGNGQNITIGTVTITGGSVKMNNHDGPPPSDGATPVYLNTLTIGNPAVGSDVSITAGSYGGVACTQDGVDGYGIKDVKTLDDGKVYFYLPESAGGDELVKLTASSTEYGERYPRAGNHDDNTQTLISHRISLSEAGEHSFLAATYGYAEQSARSVTVTNTGYNPTGELTVALSGANPSAFTVSLAPISSIDVEGTGSFTVAPNTGLDAGTCTATVTVSNTGNGISDSFNVSFTVNKMDITVTMNDTSIVYGQAVKAPSYTSSLYPLHGADLFIGDPAVDSTRADLSASGHLKAGAYGIVQGSLNISDGNSGGNYNINFVSNNNAFTVTAKPLSHDVTPVSKVYDGTNVAHSTGGLTADDVEPGDVVLLDSAFIFAGGKNVVTGGAVTAGTWGLSGADAGNYELAPFDSKQTTANITAKDVTVTMKDTSIVYGQAVKAPSYTSSLYPLYGADLFTGDPAVENSATDLSTSGHLKVGAYGIVQGNLNISDGNGGDGNYNITFVSNDNDVTVTAKPLGHNVTPADKVYDGTNVAHSTGGLTTDDIEPGDVVLLDSIFIFSGGKNVVADGAVTAGTWGLSGADAGNYELAPFGSKQTIANITAKYVTVTMKDTSIVYGQAVKAPSYTSSLYPLYGADLFTGDPAVNYNTRADLSASGHLKVGAYGLARGSLNISDGNGGDGNYNINFVSNDNAFTVTAKPLSHDVTPVSKVYDGTNVAHSTGGLTTDDIEPGDVVLLDSAFIFSGGKNVVADGAVTAGTWGLSGADAGNYELAPFGGRQTTADITAKDVTVTMKDTSIVYGQAVKAPSYTSSLYPLYGADLFTGDPAVNYNTRADLSASGHLKVGAYGVAQGSLNISDGNGGDGNYNITFVSNNNAFTVTAKPLGHSVTPVSKVYDGTNVAHSTGGLMAEDIELNDVVLLDSAFIFAGGKNVVTGGAVTAGTWGLSGADAGNYELAEFGAQTAGITPKYITVTMKDTSIVYGQAVKAPSYTSSLYPLYGADLFTGDPAVESSVTDLSASGHLKAGAYGIVQGSLNISDGNGGDGNYNINFVSNDNDVTVTAKPLGHSVTPVSKVYDGTNVAHGTGGLTTDDIEPGDVVLLDSAFIFRDGKNVVTDGAVTTSTWKLSGADAGNYELAEFGSRQAANITPKDITVTMKDTSIVYGQAVKAPSYTSSLYPLYGADLFTGDPAVNYNARTDLSASGHLKAGAYGIVQGNLNISDGNGGDGNYNITFVSNDNDVTVTAKPLGHNVTPADKVYDGTNVAHSTGGLTTDDIEPGDDVLLDSAFIFSGGKNVVADGAVTASTWNISGADAGSYELAEFGAQTAGITPKYIAITDGAIAPKTYDGTTGVTVTGLTFNGLVLPDDNGNFFLGTDYSISSAAFVDPNASVGNQTVRMTVALADSAKAINYNLTNGTGYELTRQTIAKADPAPAHLEFTPASAVWNGQPQGVSVLPASPFSGMGAATVKYSGVGATSYPESTAAPTDVGTYAVTVTIADGSNFNAATADLPLGSFTIDKSPQAIRFTPAATLPVESGACTLTATAATSGAPELPVLFRTSDTSLAEVSGNTLLPKQSGTVVVTAYVAANPNYEDAAEAPRTIVLTSSSTAVAGIDVPGATLSDDGSRYIVDNPASQTATVIVTPQDRGAKVIYGGEEAAAFAVDVSRSGTQEVVCTVVSQDGSRQQAYTIALEQRLDFDTYVAVKLRCVMIYNNRRLNEHGYTANAFRWYGNGELLATGSSYALSEAWMSFSPDVVYHFEMDTPTGVVRSTGKVFDFSTGIADVEGSKQLMLYPNPLPSGATLNVHTGAWGAGARELFIYNAAGSLVLQQRFSGALITLPFAAPAGVYFLRVGNMRGKMVAE